MKLKSLDSVLRYNRLHWFRNVKQSELYTGQIMDLEVEETEVVAAKKSVG